MDKEQIALERLKIASEMSLKLYKEPLVITYSGGKDSDVLLHLAEVSGIPFETIHSLTTADAPQTVYHVRDIFKRLEANGHKAEILMPYYKGERTSMWRLIPQKVMPPTRRVRYCCEILKEHGGEGRFIATGVRWDESTARLRRGKLEVLAPRQGQKLILNNDNAEDRRLFETCQLKGKRVVNPIVDWTTNEILDYCATEKIPMNLLYSCGFKRVGCIGCPMASKMRAVEFGIFPKYKENYIRAFERMIAERKRRGLPTKWKTGMDVFHWWMEDGFLPGQGVMEGFKE